MNYGTRLQLDIAAMLAADEQLHYVQVLAEAARGTQPGAMLFEDAVNQALLGQVPVNGKVGLAVLVFCPEGKPESRANRGLVTQYEIAVRVIENKNINESPVTGTGIACEDMLTEIMKLLQMWTPLTGHPLQVSEFYKVTLKDQDHLWAWECIVTASDAEKARPTCSQPKIEYDDINATITTVTDGAAIYYTVDGSLPTPAAAEGTSPKAWLYTGPIDIEGPATIRAMAYKTGHMPSNCAQRTL